MLSIAFKWCLIGRRKATDEETLYHQCIYWICDRHFYFASFLFWATYHNSRIWNIILMMHGMDVDLRSFFVDISVFAPSKMDLVQIRKSFLSASIHIESGKQIEIADSSVGFGVQLSGGIEIHRCNIPPRSFVNESLYDEPAKRAPSRTSTGMSLLKEFCHVLLYSLIFISVIPAYEVFTVHDTKELWAVLGLLSLVYLVQCVVWGFVIYLVETMFVRIGKWDYAELYTAYIGFSWASRTFGSSWMLWGTPMFTWFARAMGARISGQLWFFGTAPMDYSQLIFTGNTLVDDCRITGHYTVLGDLSLTETNISGVLHPGCYVHGGAVVPGGKHHGPWKMFLQSRTSASNSSHSTHPPWNAFTA